MCNGIHFLITLNNISVCKKNNTAVTAENCFHFMKRMMGEVLYLKSSDLGKDMKMRFGFWFVQCILV